MLLGTYEKACKPWSPVDTPWDFGHELLQPDSTASRRRWKSASSISRRSSAGIKQIINGPFTFAPDGNPLVGPVPGLTNFWSACAVMAGFSQGGGVGLALANWMVHGDPGATSGAWTWRATANGRRCATPTPRCARTIRAASRSASERGTAGRAAAADDPLYDIMVATTTR
jgi:dimethylglycine dehydrogenase